MMFLPNTKARPCDVPTAITFETVCKHKSISDIKKKKNDKINLKTQESKILTIAVGKPASTLS